MKFPLGTFLLAALTLMIGTVALGQEHDMSQHAAHQHGLNERGGKAMGFSQTAATHHFVLLADGGYVQATANSKEDKQTVAQIRAHLADIQKRFAAGDFSAPELTHGKVPPGVDTMQALKTEIHYRAEPVEGGGRLVISSTNARAVAGIHRFLRFQIKDHATGDPVEVRQ